MSSTRTTRRFGSFSLGQGGPYQSLNSAIELDLSSGSFLTIQATIEGAVAGSNPVDLPAGSWRLHAMGDGAATPIRLTTYETGLLSLADIAPQGNIFVNAFAVFESFPTQRGKLYYARTGGGDTARATLLITVSPAALAREKLQMLVSAASLRGPLRNEILVINLPQNSARTYNVPDGITPNQPNWKGKIVNMFADGGDVYLQQSTGMDAAVDETAVAQEVLANARYTLTPSASGNGCWKLPSAQWIPVPFGLTAQTFALKTLSAGVKLRTHVAET